MKLTYEERLRRNELRKLAKVKTQQHAAFNAETRRAKVANRRATLTERKQGKIEQKVKASEQKALDRDLLKAQHDIQKHDALRQRHIDQQLRKQQKHHATEVRKNKRIARKIWHKLI